MSFETAQETIDYLLNSALIPVGYRIVFDFIGGEPLLEIDLIEKICDYIEITLKKHLEINSYGFGITTNGILYNSPKVQKFIAKYHDILDFSISIDGDKKKNDLNRIFSNGNGSYDLIIDNVKLWLKQFPHAITKMVISSEDLPYINMAAQHLLSLGLRRLDMNLVVEDVWKENDEIIFEEQLIQLADYIIENDIYENSRIYIFEDGIDHKISKEDSLSPCRESFLSVDSSGNFYTCLRFAKFSLKNKECRSIGNLQDGINKNLLRPFFTLSGATVITESCNDCEIASGCRWCPGENYDSSMIGTIYAKATYICKLHKARVRAKNYYSNRLLNKENGRIWKI